MRIDESPTPATGAATATAAGPARNWTRSDRRDWFYRKVFDSAPVGIFHYDVDAVITAVNESLLQSLGSSREHVLGFCLFQVDNPGIREAVRRSLAGFPADYQGEYRPKTGWKRPVVRVRFAPILDGWGEIIGGVGISEDISARVQIEEERNASLALVDTLFRTAPIGLAFLDQDLRYTRINDRLAALNRLPPDEHLGRRPSELLGPVGLGIEALLRATLETGRPLEKLRRDTRDLGGDGPYRVWEASFYPVHQDGRTAGVGVVVEDVTAAALAEEERSRLYREAQEAIRVRDQFLSLASHELKTPLTPLQIRLATISRRAASGEPIDPALVRKCEESLARLTMLIDDLIDASRVGAGTMPLRPRAIDLASVVRSTLERLGPLLADRPVHVEIADGRHEVCGDPERLEQVVRDLLDNAVKYSPRGSPIEIALESRGEMELLSITDHGIGIATSEQERVYDRWYQGETARRVSVGGLGLGLYLSRGIVERLGGQIWTRSAPDAGSTFYVALPSLSSWMRSAGEKAAAEELPPPPHF